MYSRSGNHSRALNLNQAMYLSRKRQTIDISIQYILTQTRCREIKNTTSQLIYQFYLNVLSDGVFVATIQLIKEI